MWDGDGEPVSSSSDPSSVAEDSLLRMPGICGIPWEAQPKMNAKFQSSARDLRFSKAFLRDLYREREGLIDKLEFNQVQINRAKDEQRSAMRVFKANHSLILPDATNRDITLVLDMSFPALQGACTDGPLTKPDGPLYDVLAGFEPVFADPVDYFAGPSTSSAHLDNNNNNNGPSTSSAYLGSSTRRVSSTAGSVVRRNVRFVPPLLPLKHALRTDAFNAGYNSSTDMPAGGIKPLKLKRIVKKSVLATSKKYSGRSFWTATFSKRTTVLPASAGDGFPDLLASIN